MMLRRIVILSRTQIWVALIILTSIAIVLSVAIAAIVLHFTTTGDPNALHAEREVYDNVIIFSAVTPALVCPLVVYKLLTTLRDLNLARVELDSIARKDSLTGLFNRRGFDDAAASLILRARANRQFVSALMCDIDMFKQVNDTYGHDGGDAAIRGVANILTKMLEHSPDTVMGRQGGDEFAILLVGDSTGELTHFADAVRKAVESTPVVWNEEQLFLTVSLGVSMCPSQDASVTALLSRADRALYKAKDRGRNRVHVAAVADAV